MAQLTGTPLLAYQTRFDGSFFTDVVAIDRYRGQQTGFTDGELVFHNDRTAHPVRADFISLLGVCCPEDEPVCTGYVSGRALVRALSTAELEALRRPWFVTAFGVVSRDGNSQLTESAAHPILEGGCCIRYLDTHTRPAPDAPIEAYVAVLALKDALARSEKVRHRIRRGDLLVFPNQQGLHNRERPEPMAGGMPRWLLKTYALADDRRAAALAPWWIDGVPGLVGDGVPAGARTR